MKVLVEKNTGRIVRDRQLEDFVEVDVFTVKIPTPISPCISRDYDIRIDMAKNVASTLIKDGSAIFLQYLFFELKKLYTPEVKNEDS